MKKLFPVLIFSLLAFVGCSDDDDKSLPLNENVVQFIENRYPGAQIPRWPGPMAGRVGLLLFRCPGHPAQGGSELYL